MSLPLGSKPQKKIIALLKFWTYKFSPPHFWILASPLITQPIINFISAHLQSVSLFNLITISITSWIEQKEKEERAAPSLLPSFQPRPPLPQHRNTAVVSARRRSLCHHRDHPSRAPPFSSLHCRPARAFLAATSSTAAASSTSPQD